MRTDIRFMYFDEFHAWFEYMCRCGMIRYEYEKTTTGQTRIISSIPDACFNSDSVHYLAEMIYPPNRIELTTLWDNLAVEDMDGDFYKEIEWEKYSYER